MFLKYKSLPMISASYSCRHTLSSKLNPLSIITVACRKRAEPLYKIIFSGGRTWGSSDNFPEMSDEKYEAIIYYIVSKSGSKVKYEEEHAAAKTAQLFFIIFIFLVIAYSIRSVA